jgi:deazaflavin-dependent oxidoreductase (nitroreductase family)
MSRFRPTRAFRIANKMVEPLVRLGLPMGTSRAPMALLTVPGRKSGIPRTTPVALAIHDDGWLLVAVYGVSDWSQNLEAAGKAIVTRRGRSEEMRATRLTPSDAGPILRASMAEAPAMVRRMTAQYFSADATSPAAEWEREAVAHPVFVLAAQ